MTPNQINTNPSFGTFAKPTMSPRKSPLTLRRSMITRVGDLYLSPEEGSCMLVTFLELSSTGIPIADEVTQRFYPFSRLRDRRLTIAQFTTQLAQVLGKPSAYPTPDIDQTSAVDAELVIETHFLNQPFHINTIRTKGKNNIVYNEFVEFAQPDPDDPVGDLFQKDPPTQEPSPEPEDKIDSKPDRETHDTDWSRSDFEFQKILNQLATLHRENRRVFADGKNPAELKVASLRIIASIETITKLAEDRYNGR